MKLIYSQGFNNHERLEWKLVIFSNIVQSFRTISEAMSEMGYQFDNSDNEVSRPPLVSFSLAVLSRRILQLSVANSKMGG